MVAAAFILNACNEIDGPLPQQVDQRGEIVSVAEYGRYTVDEIEAEMSTITPILPALIPPRYGAVAYVVTYRTISHDGSPTLASGMVVLPDAAPGLSFPIVSYQHGTVLDKVGVASHGNGERILGLILASDGYICSMPDYLGLGYGLGFHPYVHGMSEASASIDMLRASRDHAESNSVEWNKQLFLLGYSQGGHATMATHKVLQINHSDEFSVTGSAPMAGPYDVSGVQEGVITGYDPYPTPGYLPFIIYSYDMVYDIIDAPPYTMFKPPYDSIINANMDQSRDIGYLNTILPAVPREMVLDSVMAAYESDENHPLKLALRDNNLLSWNPQAHVRMCYCKGDDQVNYMNAIVAHDSYLEAGADPELVKLIEINETSNHSDCALPSMLFAKYFFDSLRVE